MLMSYRVVQELYDYGNELLSRKEYLAQWHCDVAIDLIDGMAKGVPWSEAAPTIIAALRSNEKAADGEGCGYVYDRAIDLIKETLAEADAPSDVVADM